MDALFLILWRLYSFQITSDFLLLCIKCWFQASLHVSPQNVAAHKLSTKGEVSFPLVWYGKFVREKKQRIISAVAEGCREVAWHRHWLSLLRSEGIARLRKKKKAKEQSEWANEPNCKLDWMRCKCPGDVLAFVGLVCFVCLFFVCFSNMLFRSDQQSVMLSYFQTVWGVNG